MPKVLDLFSGVGGMSLGASQAGFTVIGAVELDPIAISSHQVNFPKTAHMNADISTLKSQDFLESFKIKKGELTGIIGGPPCQGFSTMGKQSVGDPRNSLFIHFFRIVNELTPDFFVAENVPGILDQKFDNIREEALKLVSRSYDIYEPLQISANEVGAPTTRKRIFFVGVKKQNNISLYDDLVVNNTSSPVYVRDAFQGLPLEVAINEGAWTKINLDGNNAYNRVISKAISSELVGDFYAKERYFVFNEVSGMIGTNHRPNVVSRFSNVPPGGIDKVSRAPRLDPNGFSPTLRAGTDKDKGSYQAVRPIHPIQNRVITPREAARLQGFPDWFQFHKTKWHSFRQIGNSVSPIVAKYILRKIYDKLSKE